MGGDAPVPVTRRRFLVGVVVAGTAVVVASGGVTARSLLASPSGFSALFGERTAAVAALGRSAIGAGVASADPAALVAVLPAGVELVTGRQAPIDVVDPAGLVDGLEAAVAGELAAGELVEVDDFLLTPTEAALAAACALGPR